MKPKGLSKHPLYSIWHGMLYRCYNKKCKGWHIYGGRGIDVCQEWRESFEAFAKDMGRRPSKKHSIDRIDNDKGYSKDNCRWATRKVQNNNKRYRVVATLKGKIVSVAQASKRLGVSPAHIYNRLRAGLPAKETPEELAERAKQYSDDRPFFLIMGRPAKKEQIIELINAGIITGALEDYRT